MGQIPSLFGQTFPPKSRFHVEDIPDLSGKVMIVTGANTGEFLYIEYGNPQVHDPSRSGIGKETAKVCTPLNVQVSRSNF